MGQDSKLPLRLLTIAFVSALLFVPDAGAYDTGSGAKWRAPDSYSPDSSDEDEEQEEDEAAAEEKEEEIRIRPPAKKVPPAVSLPPQVSQKDPKLVVRYVKPRDKEYRELAKALQDSKGIDLIVEAVNKTYDFPHIDVVFDMCGDENAFYDSDNKRIILCYELVAALANGFSQDEELTDDEVGNKVVASLIFTFFHELGHAAIDVFDLPITGNEEDAADRFATLILLAGDDTELADEAIGSFDLATAESLEDLDFADEHPVNEQRWYTMACLMVGSDRKKYGYLVGEDGLPERRAEICPAEYERVNKAWEQLMKEHLIKT